MANFPAELRPDRAVDVERRMGELQEAVRLLGAMVDPVPRLQEDVTILAGRVEQMQEASARMEALLTRQYGGDRGPAPRREMRDRDRGREREDRQESPVRRGRIEHRGKRLELPLFTGEDPYGWLFRADRYFSINGVEEDEKVLAASVCFEGRALGWFQWAEAQEPFASWREFRAALLHRFSRAREGDPTERLMSLKQGGSVTEYRDAFETLAAALRGVPEPIFRGAFLNGLREDIRAEVRLHRPINLQEAMDLAQQVEDRNEAQDNFRKLRMGRMWRPEGPAQGSSKGAQSSKFRRQSTSPTASRSVSSSHSHDRDPFSSHSKGSVASSGDDDVDSIHSMRVGSLDRPTTRRLAAFSNNRAPALSKKSTRAASPSSAPKRSFDYSALRQMDNRKSPPNMFRPLLSSVPSTTFYVGKASSVQRSLISRNSSVTTSSNTSSDQGISAALDTEGSDHNQDDAATEFEKRQYSDVHEEIFSFDKLDVVDEANGNELHDGSTEMDNIGFSTSPKVEFGLSEPGDSRHHGTVTEVGPSSEASLAKDDLSEVDSLEIMAVCSRCGCRYHASEQEERETKLCPECNMKDKQLRVTTLETATVADTSSTPEMARVTDTSPALSTNVSQEETPSGDLAYGMAVPVLQQVTDVSEPKSSPDMENAEEGKTSYRQESHNYLQENSLARSEVERGEGMLDTQQEEGHSAVGHGPPNDAGGQKSHHSTDYPNLKVDISEGAGISVLLKRTSSSKGPVVRGMTFSAASIPYDDLSYAKDSTSSMRSSIGHGSFSASSSVDFSARQTDGRVQRQLSGKKSDMEYCRNEKSTKSQNVGSSFSGIANMSYQAKPPSTSTNEDNLQVSIGTVEYDAARDTFATSQDHLLASPQTEADVTDTSSTRTFLVEEDLRSITVDTSTSELRPVFDSGFQDNLVESHSNNDSHALHDVEFSKDATNVTEIEALDTIPHSGLRDGEELATHSSIITTSEIENEKHTPGSQSDNVSLASKSTREEFLEASPLAPSDKEMITSASDQAHDILEEESAIMVECQKGSKARSLTLEEATDTILFCSSIVQDLAYQAATIAIEQESSEPLEGFRPTITILGRSNYDKKDPPRGRTVGNRSSKSQKPRKKRMETDAKTPATNENDENAVEPLKRNVEPPNKVDSLKPPKLESKCNCTIM